MKYSFSVLALLLCVLGYVYFEKPSLLSQAVSGLQATQKEVAAKWAASSPAGATAKGATGDASTDSSASDTNNNIPPTSPSSINPAGAEVITRDTLLPNSGHVLPVLQPGEKSGTTAASSNESPKVYVAPDPLPAQPNWKWAMAQGIYHNVKILSVDADCVSISSTDGAGTFELADLPSDLQRQLNYDPDLAAASVQAKARIAAEKEQEAAAALELKKKQLAADEAAAAQRKKDDEARIKAKATLEQAKADLPSYQDDLNFVIKHVSFSPSTGEIHGDPYFVKKYNDDTQKIAYCNQVIASGGIASGAK